ncbi:FIST N-terminal domain-containing protein [Pseudonocardia sp.]|uniref:FIST signal transduction protein n=1 Tax=Pseudonocardia sp. TaxID=60912 RepID=UPI0026084A9A|nr:FIST N-terminal domain-containing protein [Pseudonocardia sp.]
MTGSEAQDEAAVMPTDRRFGDGLAVGPDLEGAAEVAVAQALEPLRGTVPDLVWIFVAPGRLGGDAAAAAGRRAMELAGAGVTVGGTAGGVIGDGRGVEHGPAVAVWAATLPGVTVRPFRLTAEQHDGAVRFPGLPERRSDDRVAALVVDPYSFPVGGFLQHGNSTMPGFPLVGGLTGAPGGPGANRLFLDGEIHDRGGVGVLLGGDVSARTVVSQGCRPIGPAMVVTRVERNVLLELAGSPAYRRLAEIVTSLPPAEQELAARGLHVGIAMNEYADDHGRGDFLVRGVTGVDEATGAVAIGDVVEVGQTVRFQVRDAAGAGEDLTELLGPDPARGALLFSCNGRGTTMFPDADHDVQALRRTLGGGSGIAGFFAAGEIGPVGGRNHLHGFTASVLTFR